MKPIKKLDIEECIVSDILEREGGLTDIVDLLLGKIDELVNRVNELEKRKGEENNNV